MQVSITNTPNTKGDVGRRDSPHLTVKLLVELSFPFS